ncbi:flagellar filament capping protein FliD [Sporolactobacillus putidus]|uniref:Flagellar hook-associated protein 2 n=1 Tax=Sporolactobacillus putidus TaxID=492735 RepID=A0A917S339_9BACL|nr:flagellar filament capping protein FliD [Sporolactobacillus putidus]GGL54434.1 flagellar hook-associated protein 2 [Sporolactobacillus putidus]
MSSTSSTNSSSSSSGISINSINSMLNSTSNNNRVSGLVSGINVDSIVAQMMVSASQPLAQMQKNLQKLEWQRDDYRSMNTLLTTLQTNVQTMSLQSSYLVNTVSSSSPSVASATAGATAGNATYSLSVGSLATSAFNVGGPIAANSNFDPSQSLASQSGNLKDSTGIPSSGNITFTLSSYDQNGNFLSQQFSFDPTKSSLNDVLSTISQSNLGINAFYDPVKQEVSMTRSATGNLGGTKTSGYGIFFDNSGGNNITFLTNTLQMTQSNETKGSDASFTLNGLQTTRHSNTFSVNGVNFTLQGSGSSTLTVNTDTTTVYNSINNFINTYNTTIQGINDMISQAPNPSYQPLSATQKQSMTAADITAWTTKAQAGMLWNDSILSSGLSQMRLDLSNMVSGTSSSTLNSLSAIGITTSTNYRDHGKLVISDPAALNQAISTNPQAVMQLFTNMGTSLPNNQGTDPTKQGVMQRLNSTITNTINQIEQKAGNTSMADNQYFIGQNIDTLNTQISTEQTRLTAVENQYYNQFNAMEQAILLSNQQSSYISSLMH